METCRPLAMTGSRPMGANSVVPIPKAPMASASKGQFGFMLGSGTGYAKRTNGRRRQSVPGQGERAMGSRALRIQRIVLSVADLEAATEFYVHAVGFTRI